MKQGQESLSFCLWPVIPSKRYCVLKTRPVLQQGYDIIEDMYSPKTSATNFVQELCGCRAKENLAPLLQLVTSSFDVFAVRLLV